MNILRFYASRVGALNLLRWISTYSWLSFSLAGKYKTISWIEEKLLKIHVIWRLFVGLWKLWFSMANLRLDWSLGTYSNLNIHHKGLSTRCDMSYMIFTMAFVFEIIECEVSTLISQLTELVLPCSNLFHTPEWQLHTRSCTSWMCQRTIRRRMRAHLLSQVNKWRHNIRNSWFIRAN